MNYHKEKGVGKMVTKKLTGLRWYKRHEENFWGDGDFCIFTVTVVKWLYIDLRVHQTQNMYGWILVHINYT